MPTQRDLCQISLKLFLKNSEDEVLILESLDNSIFQGFYDLPGGRINQDEFLDPLKKIIQREVFEEIGQVEYILNPKPLEFSRLELPNRKNPFPLGGNLHVALLFFFAEYKSGEIKTSEEHKGFKWVKLTEENIEKLFIPQFLEGAKAYLQYLKNN